MAVTIRGPWLYKKINPRGKIMTDQYNTPPTDDISDRDLIKGILEGSRADLKVLIARYQGWIYNVALKMTLAVEDAEDISQEILIKLLTKLTAYDPDKAAFRTWLYRIVYNHVINMKKRRHEHLFDSFEECAVAMDSIADSSFTASPEKLILVEELKIKCIIGLLLCLDRQQRFVFILSEIFDVDNAQGAQILSISKDNYRQIRSRAKRKVYNFINRNCSLIQPDNPCRCHKKLKSLIELGFVDPENLLFYQKKVKSIRDTLTENRRHTNELYAENAAQQLFKDHPFYQPPNFNQQLGKYLNGEILYLFNN
jgi:RNA polymerase sigma factor (sigma-70 family)